MSKNPIQLRLLTIGSDIAGSPPEDLAFQHSVLTQCALPVSQPPGGVLSWERQQGRARLLVEAGKALHPKTGQYVQLGLPYGPKARLLLIHLNTEAVRQQSPVIPIEDTMTAFFRRLMGGKTQDGRTANLGSQHESRAGVRFERTDQENLSVFLSANQPVCLRVVLTSFGGPLALSARP